MTKVKFYMEGGTTLAVFTDLKGNNGNYTCYSRIGQHSTCHPNYLMWRKLAPISQYLPLFRELIQHGYNDLVCVNKGEEMIGDIDLKKFVNSYLATAAWVTNEPGDSDKFTRQAAAHAKNDCIEFIYKVISKMGWEKAMEVLKNCGSDVDYLAAHDFYLTRNRHGAGFWDKDNVYGEGESLDLTEVCHLMKESNAYHTAGSKSKLTFE